MAMRTLLVGNNIEYIWYVRNNTWLWTKHCYKYMYIYCVMATALNSFNAIYPFAYLFSGVFFQNIVCIAY